MAKLIHNLTNSPNLVERIKGIDRDIDILNTKVGSIPEGMDVGQSIIDLQDNKQDKLTAGEGISIENNVISNTQRPAEWGNITGDITDQVDLQNELSSISDSIPTKTSDLTNDSGFITNSVNDLVNYYLKSETYTKTEVNNLIGSIQSFHYEIYPTIGSITTPLSNVLYLIGPTGTGSDRYEEYVYSNNNFVKIGETSIDLSGYVTIDNLNNALSNYTTTANLTTLLAQKQDMLTAGAGISISNNVISNTIPGATISNTAPSDPTQGMLRYDTVNDVLKSYDGSNWNEVGNESSDINTKTFYLSGTLDLTNAQAAYDWFSAGKNPIVMYNNRAYLLYAKNATQLIFQDIENSAHDQNSYTEYVGQKVIFTLSGNDVTAINYNSTSGWSGPILRTDVDYPTPYTPAYAGSPTTKQYVDNNDTYIGASAPTNNVVEGRLWYDTTNDVLKVYDGTNWDEVGTDTIYTAGNGIDITNNEISADTSVLATKTDLNSKQDTLTAGNGINIDSNNEISADTSVLATKTDLNSKQDKLIAGNNIQIASDGKTISATDTTYTAGTGISIDANNVISSTMTTYTAGNNIDITNGVISAENVIKTDTTNDAGFEIRDGETADGQQFIDAAYRIGDIELGYEKDNGSEYTYNSVSINGNDGIIAGGVSWDNNNGDYSTGYQIDPSMGIIATRQSQSQSIDETINYNFFSDYEGDPQKIARIGDIQKAIYAGATAPSSPVEGTLWYDTTNDILKVYNGSSWVEAQNGRQGFFKTRSEYNELPDSKLTDGNTYFIIDRHSPLLEIEEMYDLYQDTGRDICIQELNIYPQEYYDKYNSEGYMNGKNLEYNGIRIAAWNSESSLWNQPR